MASFCCGLRRSRFSSSPPNRPRRGRRSPAERGDFRIAIANECNAPGPLLDFVQTINAKGRIIIHCALADEKLCNHIITELKETKYYVELNGKLIDPNIQLKVHSIICCLSKNYEEDSKRQAELRYAFKSQHRLIPIHIEHDFNAQQPWLRHILDSLLTSPIDLSGKSYTFDKACQQLRLELAKFADNHHSSVIDAFNYLNIYQECQKQGWDEIFKLLLHTPTALFLNAIDKRQSNDVTKIINLMSILNDRFNGKAQMQIDRFQQWLIHTNRTNQPDKKIKNKGSNNQTQLLQKPQEYHTQINLEELNNRQPSQTEVREQMRTVVRKLHIACEHNDIRRVRDILKSLAIDDLDVCEKNEENTALNIASQSGCYEIVQMLLEHGDSMMKGNRNGLTAFSQVKDEQTRQIFIRYQHPLPRFAGNVLEWTIAYREPAIKRAQIRQYLTRNQFIGDSFEVISRRYICCYLALEGFSLTEIDKLESNGYTSVDGFIRAYTSPIPFHKYINRHLATYALAYFDSSFDMSIPYSFIHCLLSIIASILHTIRFRTSFTGCVYRGMLITQDDHYKYIVDSRILNTAFLSTSKDRTIAEIFAGIGKDDASSEQDTSHVKVLCTYTIRNRGTAYSIEHLSNIHSESEVLIFPFSAFQVTRVQKTSSGSIEIDLNECDEQLWFENDENDNDGVRYYGD